MQPSLVATALALLLTLVAGCPKRIDPSGDPQLPGKGNAEARTRFQSARQLFEKDDYTQAGAELDQIRREYPDDPIAPFATLYAGMAAHKRGDHAAAVPLLDGVTKDESAPDEVRARARFYLGLALSRSGRHAEARRELEPMVGHLVEGEEEGELYATLAESAALSGDPEAALKWFDDFWSRARPAERAYITSRVAPIVDAMTPEQAQRAWNRAHKSRPPAAFLGRRLAAAARASGDESRAREILAESTDARSAAGMDPDGASAGNEDARLFGAVLPLSGKRRLVGLAAQRGVAVAAGTYDRSGGYSVLVRDAGDGRGRAASAVDDLAGDGVIGIIGPMDREAAEEAAQRAEGLGVPLLTLDVAGEQLGAGSPHVFRVIIPVEARARALAAWASDQGVKRFAILAPDIGYGTRAAEAFKAEVAARGGQVVAHETYPKDATAFVGPVGRIAKTPFDVLFIPDTAARLELVAPQLAVADLQARPLGTAKPRRGRIFVLMSTAEALSPKFLRGTGRYTQGAVFAPGFYPDDADQQVGDFVTRFRAAYGDDPTYLDAYAYDAALLLRTVVELGARDRASVVSALSSLRAGNSVRGVTGDIWFDPSRNRGDRGTLYTVVPDGAGGHAIRPMR